MRNLSIGKFILSVLVVGGVFAESAEARENVPVVFPLPGQINMDTLLSFKAQINNQGENSGDRLKVCLTRSDDAVGCANLNNFRDPLSESFLCRDIVPSYYCSRLTSWTAVGGEPGSYQLVAYNTGTREFSLPRHFTVTAEVSPIANDATILQLAVQAPGGGNIFRREDPVRFKFVFTRNGLPQNARMKTNIVRGAGVCNPTYEIPEGGGWQKAPITSSRLEYNYLEAGSLFPRGLNQIWTICFKVYSGNSVIGGAVMKAQFTVQ